MNDKYADCTLLELYELLQAKNIKIECPIEFKTLAIMAEQANIEPKNLEVSMPPIWVPEKGRYDEYCIRIHDENGTVIFRIMEGDIIIMSDCARCVVQEFFFNDKDDVDAGIYYIEDDDVARDMLTVCLINLDTNREIKMCAWQLIKLIDCEDTLYESSRWLDYINKK
jgi:hypothetical protein